MLSKDSDEGGQVGRKSIKGRSPRPFSPPFFLSSNHHKPFCKPLLQLFFSSQYQSINQSSKQFKSITKITTLKKSTKNQSSSISTKKSSPQVLDPLDR